VQEMQVYVNDLQADALREVLACMIDPSTKVMTMGRMRELVEHSRGPPTAPHALRVLVLLLLH
jgi:hypothetical protein